MRLPCCILAISLLLGAGLMLGCGEQPGKPMKDALYNIDAASRAKCAAFLARVERAFARF